MFLIDVDVDESVFNEEKNALERDKDNVDDDDPGVIVCDKQTVWRTLFVHPVKPGAVGGGGRRRAEGGGERG